MDRLRELVLDKGMSMEQAKPIARRETGYTG